MSPSSTTCSDPTTALTQFRIHFLKNKGFIHPSLELVHTQHAGVTLRVKEKHEGVFPPGEVAISCPHWTSLSALNAGCVDGGLDWWEGVGASAGRDRNVGGDSGSGENGTGDEVEHSKGEEAEPKRKTPLELLAELRHHARPQFVAAIWIAAQYLLGEESLWARYFDILPGLPEFVSDGAAQDVPGLKRGLGELDTPLWWDEEERGWLQNTNLAKGIADLEGVWEQEWKRWESVVEAWGEEVGVRVTW